MSSLTTSPNELQDHYDVVIIGSGYGGGVAASRLARMGLRICVLEKGRQWRPGDFSNTVKGLWDRSRMTGRIVNLGPDNALFDLRLGKQMHVLSACGLGGGSLINAGLAFRPEPWVFAQQSWPTQIAGDKHLSKGFERAEKILNVAPCPGGADLLKFKSLQTCAKEIEDDHQQNGRVSAELIPSTINYKPGFNKANVMQSACTQCGDCWMGCNVGAKTTISNSYLTDATHFGASLFTNMDVKFVRKQNDHWRIFYDQLEEASGKLDAKGAIKADMIILSAGVIGTTEILMRSKQQGLALSQQLGKGFSANGDDLAFGHDMPDTVNGIAVGHPPRTKTAQRVGPNCIGMISLQEEDNRQSQVKLQAGTMITLMAALAPVKSLLRGKPLRALKILINGAYKGVLTSSQCFYIVGHDDASGELKMKGDRALLEWPDVANQPVFGRAEKILSRLFEKLGAEYMQNPVRDTILGGKLITVHPLGGCRMADSAENGVVDHQCRVFDPSKKEGTAIHKGLYIVDGSIIPSSLGANPLLTIAALAERAMILLAKERGLEFDDEPHKDAPARDAFM
ncbi:MAG: GMC family oxidoreductase [bacterium]|nr:GMC family oxidoreductase [bacterium]